MFFALQFWIFWQLNETNVSLKYKGEQFTENFSVE